MKRTLPAIVCLLIGIGLGWSFCYFGPVAKHQRELLAEYRYAKDNFHLTDAEMAQMGRDFQQYGKNMIREDELLAAVALSALKSLESGETDDAKTTLLRPVGMYYRLYHDKVVDKSLLEKIETAAKEYPSIAAEISREPDKD
jgi:hypothetical protein